MAERGLTDFGSGRTALAWRLVFGVSVLVFPFMLLVGFATHPNILSFSMVSDVGSWAEEWRTSEWFHIGHLLVMLAVPLITLAAIGLTLLLKGRGVWYGFCGSLLGIFGAFMLAVDKGALTFVLTAFKDMPTSEFTAITPALEAIFNRDGWLWITWGFVALPIAFIVITIGLLREAVIPKWQGFCLVVGLLLLMNPDIEIISTVGAILMCLGFTPIGWGMMTGHLMEKSEQLAAS